MREGQKRDFARRLRRETTDTERMLWRSMRHRQLAGHRFRRQCPIGPCIADFVCIDRRLIVGVDGGQHADSARDVERDAHLGKLGFRVLRFWNNEVLEQIEGVCDMILESLSAIPHPCPVSGTGQALPPQAGEGEVQVGQKDSVR